MYNNEMIHAATKILSNRAEQIGKDELYHAFTAADRKRGQEIRAKQKGQRVRAEQKAERDRQKLHASLNKQRKTNDANKMKVPVLVEKAHREGSNRQSVLQHIPDRPNFVTQEDVQRYTDRRNEKQHIPDRPNFVTREEIKNQKTNRLKDKGISAINNRYTTKQNIDLIDSILNFDVSGGTFNTNRINDLYKEIEADFIKHPDFLTIREFYDNLSIQDFIDSIKVPDRSTGFRVYSNNDYFKYKGIQKNIDNILKSENQKLIKEINDHSFGIPKTDILKAISKVPKIVESAWATFMAVRRYD